MKCGSPVELIGSHRVAACPSCDQVFRCTRCGQASVFVGGWAPPDHPELASGICRMCRLRERAEAIPAADVEAICAAMSGGTLLAVKVTRERLSCSLHDAVSLVDLLTGNTE